MIALLRTAVLLLWQPAHRQILPGAWHTLLGDTRAVFPQHQGQSHHKQVGKSWLSSPGQGSRWKPKEEQTWCSLAVHTMWWWKIHQRIIVREWPTVQEQKEFMLCKVGGICLQAMQNLFVLTRRTERFFSYLSSAALSRLENRFKRVRIWFLNTHNIKLFSFSIII